MPKFQIFSGDVTFLGFYDAGRVRVNNTPLPTSTSANFVGISALGVGLSIGKDNDFLLKTTVAWRGENDKALAWLERAYDQHDGGLLRLDTEPMLAGVRKDPRYPALRRKMGFPE